VSYVFDNSPLSVLFKNFYRRAFRSLWERFDELVDNGDIVSTREVLREIEDRAPDNLQEWTKQHRALFTTPTAAEAEFVARIYRVTHFQQNIEQQKLLKGGRVADAFVIAKAAVDGSTVVTMELFKPNAVKIPNICRHFNVPCLTLEEFMEAEGWEF
jgi:Domain of unknown function (DUF4411)